MRGCYDRLVGGYGDAQTQWLILACSMHYMLFVDNVCNAIERERKRERRGS